MVNLHINDSFLPLMISMLHAENIMCRQLVRMVGNAAIVRVHTFVCVCVTERDKSGVCVFVCHCLTAGKCQQMFCLFPA